MLFASLLQVRKSLLATNMPVQDAVVAHPALEDVLREMSYLVLEVALTATHYLMEGTGTTSFCKSSNSNEQVLQAEQAMCTWLAELAHWHFQYVIIAACCNSADPTYAVEGMPAAYIHLLCASCSTAAMHTSHSACMPGKLIDRSRTFNSTACSNVASGGTTAWGLWSCISLGSVLQLGTTKLILQSLRKDNTDIVVNKLCINNPVSPCTWLSATKSLSCSQQFVP
jgi:hypothetical protein